MPKYLVGSALLSLSAVARWLQLQQDVSWGSPFGVDLLAQLRRRVPWFEVTAIAAAPVWSTLHVLPPLGPLGARRRPRYGIDGRLTIQLEAALLA